MAADRSEALLKLRAALENCRHAIERNLVGPDLELLTEALEDAEDALRTTSAAERDGFTHELSHLDESGHAIFKPIPKPRPELGKNSASFPYNRYFDIGPSYEVMPPGDGA